MACSNRGRAAMYVQIFDNVNGAVVLKIGLWNALLWNVSPTEKWTVSTH